MVKIDLVENMVHISVQFIFISLIKIYALVEKNIIFVYNWKLYLMQEFFFSNIKSMFIFLYSLSFHTLEKNRY